MKCGLLGITPTKDEGDEVVETKGKSEPIVNMVFECVLRKPHNRWTIPNTHFKKMMYPVTEKCATMFPVLAMRLSAKGVDGYNAACVWNSLFGQFYNYRYQDWMRIKKPQQVKEKKTKSIFDNMDVIREYASINDTDIPTVMFAIKMYPDDMKKELEEIQYALDNKTDDIDIEEYNNTEI